MAEIESGGNGEVSSSSEVSETSAAETGGEASEATQEATTEEAGESGGFNEDTDTTESPEDSTEEDDESDSEEESDDSQEVGFSEGDDAENADSQYDGSDYENDDTSSGDENSVGFDDSDDDISNRTDEDTDSDVDPSNSPMTEDNDESLNEHNDYEDESSESDWDDQEDEDLGEIEDYSDKESLDDSTDNTQDDSETQTEDTDSTADGNEADGDMDNDGETDGTETVTEDGNDIDNTQDDGEAQTEDTDSTADGNEADGDMDNDGETDGTETVTEDGNNIDNTQDDGEAQTEDTDSTTDGDMDNDGEADGTEADTEEDDYDEDEDPGELEEYSDEDTDNRNEDDDSTNDSESERDQEEEEQAVEKNQEAADRAENETENADVENADKSVDDAAESENKNPSENVAEQKAEPAETAGNSETDTESNPSHIGENDNKEAQSTNSDNETSDNKEDNSTNTRDQNEKRPDDIESKADTSEGEDAYLTAVDNMTKYMSEHNYGLDDYAKYSNDPEWQKLNSELQQSLSKESTSETPESEDAYLTAVDNMTKYMSEHNYGFDDYAKYSKDPEWQKLNSELQQSLSKESTSEIPENSREVSENHDKLNTPNEAQKLGKEGFLTNDGERITYQEAVERITGKAEEYMKSMGVSEEKISAVKTDIEQSLYKQEIEARSRGIGDHGIRHIYGNFERGENYLSSRKDVSSEQKLGVLVSQTYHDEGYTLKNEKVDNSGTLHGGADKKHDEASLDVWNNKKELYSGIFSENTMGSIEKAIGEHNIGVKDKEHYGEKIDGTEKIKENTSNNADVIVSTVHISDKLALSEREKFSDVLLKEPKLVELTEGMNSVFKSMSNEKSGFYDGKDTRPENLTAQGKELLDSYHKEIKDYIDRNYSETDAAKMKSAIEKDVGFDSGRFSSRMNYIYTPSDCYQYDAEKGCNKITVYKIDYGDTASQDLQNNQLKKLYEDLGLTEEEIASAIEAGGFEDETRGLSVHVETMTEDEIKLRESEKFQENNDLGETNERIEDGRAAFQELNEKISNTFNEKNSKDVTFEEYKDLCAACEVKASYSKEDWNKSDNTEKEKTITSTIHAGIISKTNNILRREEKE